MQPPLPQALELVSQVPEPSQLPAQGPLPQVVLVLGKMQLPEPSQAPAHVPVPPQPTPEPRGAQLSRAEHCPQAPQSESWESS